MVEMLGMETWTSSLCLEGRFSLDPLTDLGIDLHQLMLDLFQTVGVLSSEQGNG